MRVTLNDAAPRRIAWPTEPIYLQCNLSIATLGDWPRSQDKDVYQFAGALLPV